MDITLERILSLIPKNENGRFVHGAKKDFAQSIGFESGDVVAMWVKGSSASYKNYLYAIAAKYGVSVEWLKGETDEKYKGADDDLTELLDMLRTRPECRMLLSTVKGATREEVEENVRFIEALRKTRND